MLDDDNVVLITLGPGARGKGCGSTDPGRHLGRG
jgi:hypothetical protein